MSVLITLLANDPYVYLPQSLVGRLSAAIGGLLFLGLIVFLLVRWRRYNASAFRRVGWVWLGLLLSVPVTGLFFGLSLPSLGALPPPWLPVEPTNPALMFFAAVPWVLAGGLLGPLPAAIIGGLAGVLQGLWDTHSPFTPLEMVLLAVLMSVAIKQRYRLSVYALLRRPAFTAFILALLYPILFLVTTMLSADGSLAVRLDFALTRVRIFALAMAGELLIAALVAELAALAFPHLWKSHVALLPAPPEKSLQARFIYTISPLAVILVIMLMIASWKVAEMAARQMLSERMADAARVAAEGVPYFLHAGQNLLMEIGDDGRLLSHDLQTLREALSEDMLLVPFFTQLYVLDDQGEMLAWYPLADEVELKSTPEEQAGVTGALAGIPYQGFTWAPLPGQTAAGVSMLVPLRDAQGSIQRVLVGRTNLSENPMTTPILAALGNLSGADGEAILLDEEQRILYHPNPAMLMKSYGIPLPETAGFFEDTAPEGTRRLVHYRPMMGHPWSVLISIPMQRVQAQALNIAAPLMGMLLILGVVSALLLRYSLRRVTGSLESLAAQASNIAQGELDQPMPVSGEDEVGQLSRAFEQMRLSLKARLEEQNRLLIVSQGVASSLEMEQAVRPVLEAALVTGASSARVVLAPSILFELNSEAGAPIAYWAGSAGDNYRYLDEQILELTRQQERLVLTSLTRTRVVNFKVGMPRPRSLLAVALRHENQYYGTLWVAFDQPRQFSEAEVRFVATLGGYAALASANAHLFANAEIGRQRLSAILASTPDPVLVTDQQNRLLLANPAAWRALGIGVDWDEGQPIERILSNERLLKLLRDPSDEKPSDEITLSDGRVYYATASNISVEGKRVGRVCVMRDITHFKKLDALKSDFVAAVSHDLRSPLTLIQGYVSMLEMVGDLNEQQMSYVSKINGAVDSMSRLVNNLLDLGRIEAGVGLQIEKVSIEDVIERVMNGLRAQAQQKRVNLLAEPMQPPMPMIEADSALLQQALQNLVDNAIKYTDSGGEVRLKVNVYPERVVFEVRDTGIGIAPVDQPRLFEKFYRGAHRGGKQPRGTGLGLAIVRSIAERHGGKVWLESQLGKGSVFYLAIPTHYALHDGVE